MAAPVVTVHPQTVLLNTPIAVTDLFDATATGEPITSYTFFDSRGTNDTGFFTVNGTAMANGAPFTVTPEQLSTVFYVASSQVGFERIGVLARNRVGEYSQADNLARVYSVRANTSTPFVSKPDFEVIANEVVHGSEFLIGFDPDGYPITEFEISDANGVNYLQATPGRIWVGSYKHNFSTGESVTIQNSADSAFNISGVANFHSEHMFWVDAPGVIPGFGDTSGASAFSSAGGFFEYEGMAQDRGTAFRVAADKVDELVYRASGPADLKSIFLKGYDGAEWSFNNRGEVRTRGNENVPFVQFTRSTTPAGLAHNFTDSLNVADADGNSMKLFRFFNTSPHANHGELVFKGQTMPRLTWFDVTTEDLQYLEFHTTNNINVEQLIRVQAFDGKYNSPIGTHAIETTPPEVTPELTPTVDYVISEQLRDVQLAPIFQKTDTGNPHTLVQVFEASTAPESGALQFNGVPLAAAQVHEFDKAAFDSGVTFRTGDFFTRHLDTVYQRNFNGSAWSPWAKTDMLTEPEYEDILTSGSSWTNLLPRNASGELVISFSFMQQFPDYNTGEAIDGDPLLGQDFQIFTDAQRDNTRLAFRHLEEFIDVQFVEVGDTTTNVFGGTGGIFRFGEYGLPFPDSTASAFAFFPSTAPSGGDIWINRLNYLPDPSLSFEIDTWGYKVLLHEMGHALGLKHPHDGSPRLPPSTDVNDFSVMSYQQAANGEPSTYQLYDINELQDLYGANMEHNTEDNTYSIADYFSLRAGTNLLTRSSFVETIWDAGGTDWLSAVDSPVDSTVDLRAGQQSSIGDFPNNVTLAFGTEIENARGGSFNDQLIGNHMDNHIFGGDGDDVITGNQGDDLLTGAAGNDRFVWGVGDHHDTINENALAGRDTIEIPSFPNVDDIAEDLKFSLNGRDLVIDLTIDGGSIESSITVVNQTWGGFRVESLEIGDQKIDLVNLTSQLAPGEQKMFEILGTASDFGSLVTPV